MEDALQELGGNKSGKWPNFCNPYVFRRPFKLKHQVFRDGKIVFTKLFLFQDGLSLSIKTKHKALKSVEPDIKRMRDILSGQRRIISEQTSYFPKPINMSPKRYTQFINYATFQDITSNTLKEYRGKAFRKDPTVEVPHIEEEILSNIDNSGTHISQFAELVFDAVAREGRIGVLVRRDSEEGNPYFSVYPTDTIINWSGGRGEGSWVVLTEKYPDPDSESKYEQKTLTQYVEYSIRGGALYRVTVRERGGRFGMGGLDTPSEPEMLGTMDTLPFVPITIEGVNFRPDLFPLLGIANLNLRHSKLSTNLDYALAQAQDPITYISGWKGASSYEPGKEDVLFGRDQHFEVGVAEHRGYQIGNLRLTIGDVERSLRYSGAAAMEDSKRQVEAAEAVRLRQAAQSNKIIDIIKGCELGMVEAFYLLTKMFPSGGLLVPKQRIIFSISRDLVEIRLPPEDVSVLIELAEKGFIDEETLIRTLYEGENIPRDTNTSNLIEFAKAERKRLREAPNPSGRALAA